MKPQASGTGLGKLILCGEHAVVYGHPALAFAVDRHTTVTLSATDGPLWIDAPGIDDPRLAPALCTLLPAHGLRVRIASNIPVGRGMGSSAALAVALVRARAQMHGQDLDADAIFEAALPVERVFHGNPSGLDVAVSCRGGFLAYRRGPPPQIELLGASVPWRVVVLDTGTAGDTAALVASVASRGRAAQAQIARIGALVSEARAVLQDPRALGELLNENQALLAAVGVSSSENDRLVDLARTAGALGAKLSGAGGGGVVLALVEDPGPVLAAAHAAGVQAFACGVGSCP